MVAVLDRLSRKVLELRPSVTLENAPRLKALCEAIRRLGRLEIKTTDQGSQFKSIDSITALEDAAIQIGMEANGLGATASSLSVCRAASKTRKARLIA